MDNQNSPLDPFPGETHVDPAGGVGSVADSSEGMTLAELNALTGREYKDKATALKAIKDTYAMVGKVGQLEPKIQKLNEQLKEKNEAIGEIKQIKEQLFYSNNPQYAPYKETIAAMGENPAEVVEKEAFKKIFVPLSEYEKTKSAQSVLVSNPRIGQAKTKIDEAKDKQIKGQYVDANSSTVAAVLEAYELK